MSVDVKNSEVVEIIRGFLSEEFEVPKDEIVPEANMQQTLDLDSLDYVDLVVMVDNHFGFKMIGEDFKNIKTFDDFYSFVSNRLNK